MGSTCQGIQWCFLTGVFVSSWRVLDDTTKVLNGTFHFNTNTKNPSGTPLPVLLYTITRTDHSANYTIEFDKNSTKPLIFHHHENTNDSFPRVYRDDVQGLLPIIHTQLILSKVKLSWGSNLFLSFK
jgi:hypothetical protein